MIFAFIYLIIKVQEGEDMIKLAVIADDLTGANDTALQFAKRNIKSSVEINFMIIRPVCSIVPNKLFLSCFKRSDIRRL